MGKGALALQNEIKKKEHRASPLGQIEHKLLEFYDDSSNRRFFEDDEGKPNKHAKWIDIHRATTRSKQTDLEIEFDKEVEALNLKYKTLVDELLITAMNTEHDYLLALQHE